MNCVDLHVMYVVLHICIESNSVLCLNVHSEADEHGMQTFIH